MVSNNVQFTYEHAQKSNTYFMNSSAQLFGGCSQTDVFEQDIWGEMAEFLSHNAA
jgi:hypothetical protein